MKEEIKEIISMSADEDIEIKCINEKGSYVYKNIDIYELLDYITNLQEENKRLNKIINELENYLFGQLQLYGGGGMVQEYYDKIKELKGE